MMPVRWYLLISTFIVLLRQTLSFAAQRNVASTRSSNRQLTMRWVFGKGRASLQNLGCIGAEGEYYFHPEKPATIKGGPADTLGESQTIAILPHDKVIVPQGKEWLNVYDMKHRQLISDRNSFGICYYSQTDMKVGLVGTTVKVEERRIEEDGRVIALVKGIERFYIEKVIADKPYIVAKVRPFTDYSDTDPDVLEAFETNVLNEILCSFKYMEIMYPHKNYTMGSGLVKYRPATATPGVRNVHFASDDEELHRRSMFSFAVAEMLQVHPATKQMLLQEHLVERRFTKFLENLEKGCEFLQGEILSQGLMSESAVANIREEVTCRGDDCDFMKPTVWVPENYKNGQWVQQPTFFD